MGRCSSCSERAALVALAVAVAACGKSRPTDAGPAASVAASTGIADPPASASAPAASASAAAADAGPDLEKDCPDFVPSRWEPFKGYELEKECWLFSPASKETMPRPLAWEPCGRDEFGAGCRRLRLGAFERLAFDEEDDFRVVDATAGRAPRIQLMRSCTGSKSRLYTVSEPDGPTLFAYADDSTGSCQVMPALTADAWVADATVRMLNEAQNWQPIENLPTAVGVRGQLAPKLLGQRDPSPKPLAGVPELSRYERPKREALPAMRVPEGMKQPVPRVGTDGKDLVFGFVSQPRRPDGPVDVLRAPWTPDPQSLSEVVRVVTLREVDLGASFVVGCGFAATSTEGGAGLLIRLRDGVVFHFPKLCAPLDTAIGCTTRPLAITCKDVFLAVGGKSPNVYRVALDGLPPGKAPPEPPKKLEPLAGDPADAGPAASASAAPPSDAGR